EVMNTLTHTLQQLGYPLCTGNVMVNNPQWVKTQTEWKSTISDWTQRATPERVMDLAIVADAHAVAGNKSLLTPIEAHLQQSLINKMLLLQTFVRPALQFSLPLT
ncbi:DUF294 nucleotidyltransferase-like domain-containing protein, partial [Vibrio campbellii]